MSSPLVEIRSLSKAFTRKGGERVLAIDDVDLDVNRGEFTVLIGPSGCGKTTLLRCIAGLEEPDSGVIRIGSQTVYDSAAGISVPPEKRRISMVFQSYALWPHMTAFDNVRYPLTTGGRRMPKAEQRDRVREVLTTVGIPQLLDQYPKQMSGGQQQRVALARALVMGTELVLFDEPLSNVDAKVREQLRIELLAMQDRLGFAAIFVTHDQTEAMVLGDQIAVLGGGRIAQLGAPRDVYSRPANRYVADFIGSANDLPVVPSKKAPAEGIVTFASALGAVAVAADQVSAEGEAVAVWRPEHARLSRSKPVDARNVWRGTVVARLYLGSHEEFLVDVDGVELVVWTTDPLGDVQKGDGVWVSVDPSQIRVLEK